MIKITLIVIGAFVSFIPINISANESKKIPNIGEEFYLADFVSPVYEGDDRVTVYNRKDEEMTKKFIVETRDCYIKKDYKKIKEYLLENDIYVTKKANEDPSNRIKEWYLINASCVTKNQGGYLQINSSFIPAWDYRYMDANVTTYKAAPVVNNFQWTPMY